jgi:hypothetical protein
VGGANNTHTQTDTSSSVCTHTNTNISTDPNQLIHSLWTTHGRSATQNHTRTETLIDILRQGCLGILPVIVAAVWHVAGVVLCAGESVRHSITHTDPHLPTGTRSATGLRAAECIGRGVSPTSWCCVVLLCRRGCARPRWAGMVRPRRRGLRAGSRFAPRWALRWGAL